MKKCIVQYKNVNENYNCWCNSSWCDKCSTKDLRSEDTCDIAAVDFVVREKDVININIIKAPRLKCPFIWAHFKLLQMLLFSFRKEKGNLKSLFFLIYIFLYQFITLF